MALSLVPNQIPEQRIHTLTIEEIVELGKHLETPHPPLENYFSPTRKERFIKDYLHYLNTSLLEAKHGYLNLDLYLVFVFSFQFTAPLLKIPAEKELGIFYRILEHQYEVDELNINLHFSLDDTTTEGRLGEADALDAFRQELQNSYEGRREIKEPVQKRLKLDGIEAIMKWQQIKGLTELAEAFGRSIVIPSFFSFTDKKLIDFYRRSTEGITYEVAIPEFEKEDE